MNSKWNQLAPNIRAMVRNCIEAKKRELRDREDVFLELAHLWKERQGQPLPVLNLYLLRDSYRIRHFVREKISEDKRLHLDWLEIHEVEGIDRIPASFIIANYRCFTRYETHMLGHKKILETFLEIFDLREIEHRKFIYLLTELYVETEFYRRYRELAYHPRYSEFIQFAYQYSKTLRDVSQRLLVSLDEVRQWLDDGHDLKGVMLYCQLDFTFQEIVKYYDAIKGCYSWCASNKISLDEIEANVRGELGDRVLRWHWVTISERPDWNFQQLLRFQHYIGASHYRVQGVPYHIDDVLAHPEIRDLLDVRMFGEAIGFREEHLALIPNTEEIFMDPRNLRLEWLAKYPIMAQMQYTSGYNDEVFSDPAKIDEEVEMIAKFLRHNSRIRLEFFYMFSRVTPDIIRRLIAANIADVCIPALMSHQMTNENYSDLAKARRELHWEIIEHWRLKIEKIDDYKELTAKIPLLTN